MNASRTAARTTARFRCASARSSIRSQSGRQVRFATTNQQAAAAGGSSGLVGGIAGGSLVFLAGYSYYYFSGAKSVVNATSQTKAQLSKLSKEIQSSSPEPNEAIKWLHSTAMSYAAYVPGAKSYVDAAFKDLEQVQQTHSGEVDKIVNDTYKELKNATKNGVSIDTAAQTWEIIEKAITELGKLVADSTSEVLDNHPQIKEKVGGNLDQLKGMADSYGPEAKEQVEQMYQQIKDIVKGGVSAESISKIQGLIQEKTEKVKKMGDEAWEKSLEHAKPYLDKYPQVKEMVEKNADVLKKGNVTEVFEKVKSAVDSGNIDDLREYVKQAGDKSRNSGLGQKVEQYAKMTTGGSEIMPRLQKLQEVAKTRGDDAERILTGAYEDIKQILEKRIGEAENLAETVGKDAKQ